jgi:hypothetical protein
LQAGAATITQAGSTYVLTVPVTFKTLFAGTRNTYLRVQDNAGTMTSFVRLGGWTVR